MWRKSLFLLLIALVLVGTTGCIKIKKDTPQTGNLGGVFYTSDRMETWGHRSLLMTPGEKAGTIGGANAYFIEFDPSDSNAMYLGTRENGLYYSYNGGAGWTQATSLGAEVYVRDIAIDPKNKCRLYALVGTKVFQSVDCARTWKSVYFTDSAAKYTSVVEIDWYDPAIVWVGLSDGSLIKSEDYGVTWKPIKKFAKRIRKMVVDPFDSRRLYVGIIDNGLYRSDDKGGSWDYLNEGMKDYKGAKNYFDFAVSAGSEGMLLYASDYGILRSLDGGLTWSKLNILHRPGEEDIFAIEIDPENANNMYYATDRALYKSLDGGTNWAVKKMPTTRIARDLTIHPKDSTKIFLSAFTLVD